MNAKVAKILAGTNNENFKQLFEEIKDLSLRKITNIKLAKSPKKYKWIEDLGFESFKEVMEALGYHVYNNAGNYNVIW